MKILFCLSARLGDVLLGTPSFRALHRKYPDAQMEWLTLPAYTSLVPLFAKAIPHEGGPFGSYPTKAELAAWGYGPEDKVFYVQPMWRHTEWEHSREHLIDLIAKWCDVTIERKFELDITDEDRRVVDGLGLPTQPFATVCSSPCYSAGDYWRFGELHEVSCQLINRGFPVVTVGGADGMNLPGCLSCHGKTTPKQTTELINRSVLYVGPDTGVSCLACAAPNPQKVCVLDINRLKLGVIGFQGFLEDPKITDVWRQRTMPSIIEVILSKL